jgi:hypothetical protein
MTEFLCDKLGFAIDVVREPRRVPPPIEAPEDLLAHFDCHEPTAEGAIALTVRRAPITLMLDEVGRRGFLAALLDEHLKHWRASTSAEDAEYLQDASGAEIRFESMHPVLGETHGRAKHVISGGRLYELLWISGSDQNSVSLEGDSILDSFRVLESAATSSPVAHYFEQYLPNRPTPSLEDLKSTSAFGLFDVAAKQAGSLRGTAKRDFLLDTTEFLAFLLVQFHGALPVDGNITEAVSLDDVLLFVGSWPEKCLADPIGDSIQAKCSVFLKDQQEEPRSQPTTLLKSDLVETLCDALGCQGAANHLHDRTIRTLEICVARDKGDFTRGSLQKLWQDVEEKPEQQRLAALFIAIKLRDYASQGILNAANQVQSFVPQTVEALFTNQPSRFAYANFVAGLSYLQDAPVGPNGDLFKAIWKLSKKAAPAKSDDERLAALRLMLALIEKKGFHDEIGDFKRILKLLPESAQEMMQAFRPKHPQRCFLVIGKLYREYPHMPLGTKRILVELLDTARGSAPSVAWEKKKALLEDSGFWWDVDEFARWIHLDDDLHESAIPYGSSDLIFNRFHKAAQWILYQR